MMVRRIPKLTIGRLFGAPVRVDISFLLVPLVVLWAFPASQVTGTPVAVAGIVVAIFLSVLAHEVGHAAVARRYGVGVSAIVVGGFFGYAALKKAVLPRPHRVAILLAGPLVNLAVFVVMWLALAMPEIWTLPLAGPATDVSLSAQLMRVAAALMTINLAMFVFNLLPAFPLDGGRILRHLLDRVLSEQWSVRVVANLGMLVGAISVTAGLQFSPVMIALGAMLLLENINYLRTRKTSANPAARKVR